MKIWNKCYTAQQPRPCRQCTAFSYSFARWQHNFQFTSSIW